MSEHKWKNIKKLALSVVVFEGSELLFNIITELRNVVDYVSIGLLRKSYHGDRIPLIDLNEIFRLRDEDHLVDKIVEIDLDTSKAPRELETDKRNMLIQDAEDNGCSHIIVIDSDEYYIKKSFLLALREIDENDYEMTYCLYINYYHDFTHYLVYPFSQGMYVPFVSKVKYRHSFECTDFPLPSDPTRRFVRPFDYVNEMRDGKLVKVKKYLVEYHIFPWNVVKMHHLSWLRADIRKKLNMWSSKTCFSNYHDLIDRAVASFDNFSDDDPLPTACMLFNTPDNKVDIKTLPRQYIHPACDYHTRLRPCKDLKNLLVINLSSDESPLFDTLEKSCRETWAKDILDGKFPNIEYWSVHDSKNAPASNIINETKSLLDKLYTQLKSKYDAFKNMNEEAKKSNALTLLKYEELLPKIKKAMSVNTDLTKQEQLLKYERDCEDNIKKIKTILSQWNTSLDLFVGIDIDIQAIKSKLGKDFAIKIDKAEFLIIIFLENGNIDIYEINYEKVFSRYYIDISLKRVYILIENDKIKENVYLLFTKFKRGVKVLEDTNVLKNKYDYVLRTNTSTWLNIPLLDEFLAYQTDNSISFTMKWYSAYWSTFHIYMSGPLIILSKFNMEVMYEHREMDTYAYRGIADDVTISSLYLSRCIKYKIDEYKKMLSLEGYNLLYPYKSIDWNSIDYTKPCIQIKTFLNKDGSSFSKEKRITEDVKKMKTLEKHWREFNKRNSVEDLVKKTIEGMNKEVRVIRVDKNTYMNVMSDKDKTNIQFKEDAIIPVEEAREYLVKRRKECGYKI